MITNTYCPSKSLINIAMSYELIMISFFNLIMGDSKDVKICLFDLNKKYTDKKSVNKTSLDSNCTFINSTYVSNYYANPENFESERESIYQFIYLSELIENTNLVFRILSEKYNLD